MILIEIRCDACGKVGNRRTNTPLEDLREKLEERGWVFIPSQNKDLCPDCKPKRSRKSNEN